MAGISPGSSQEEILAALTREAQRLWGSDRAKAIESYLENTAKQLGKTGRTLPEPEVEPGYFQ